jgi:hypothetical protein
VRTQGISSLRGWLLGSWIGFALALFFALEQRHSPEHFLLNAGLAAIPLGLLGALTASAIAYQPPPGERLRFLLRRLGHQLTDEDIQTLLIDPSATQYVKLINPTSSR